MRRLTWAEIIARPFWIATSWILRREPLEDPLAFARQEYRRGVMEGARAEAEAAREYVAQLEARHEQELRRARAGMVRARGKDLSDRDLAAIKAAARRWRDLAGAPPSLRDQLYLGAIQQRAPRDHGGLGGLLGGSLLGILGGYIPR